MKGESVPKKSESTETELEKLLDKGSRNGSITEDEIQVALKDVEVSDAQLTTLYSALRNRGVEIVSQGDDEDALDVEADDFSDDDDLDGDSSEDHDIKVAKNADEVQEEVACPHDPFAQPRARHRRLDRHAHRRPGPHVPQGDR